MKTFSLGAILIFLFIPGTPLNAQMTEKVIAAFSGKILLSADALIPKKNDKETIAAFKTQNLSKIVGENQGEGTLGWRLHYTIFPTKRFAGTLKLSFYKGTKLGMNTTLTGIKTDSKVIEGTLSFTTADGVQKGLYTINLVDTIKGKEVILATTSVTLN